MLSPKTEIGRSMALCVTACGAAVPFLIVLLLLSVLPRLHAGPWLSSALGSTATPLGLAKPSRGRHLLPFRAGIETFNTRQTLQSLPVYLKKALHVLPRMCQVARVHQRGQPWAFVLGGCFLPKTSRAIIGQFDQTGFFIFLLQQAARRRFAAVCQEAAGMPVR